MTVVAAPLDKSGGFMTVQYSDGTDTHRQRLHILPFDPTTFVTGAGATASGADSGNHDYAYKPFRSGGPESGVVDTFSGYANIWKTFYNPAWTLVLLNIYQNINNVLTQISPLPIVTPTVGTSAGVHRAGVLRAAELIMNFKTLSGSRARLVFIAQAIDSPEVLVPTIVTPTTGGQVAEQAMVAYASGSATALVGHDGSRFAPTCRITGVVNKRLRARYGYA